LSSSTTPSSIFALELQKWILDSIGALSQKTLWGL
jgi:hypothetical protein